MVLTLMNFKQLRESFSCQEPYAFNLLGLLCDRNKSSRIEELIWLRRRERADGGAAIASLFAPLPLCISSLG
ncbi:hypothetical protein IQ230_25030 [Gloeocapsopsis crepidinum LEGE 06123]|uniref:Transposase n=1 Tax=Gloeocapsopsis crepidinum LEGE 06123 TaxID=588587 RepID=A0ABR9UZ25_9CHRO|nr:hypothetical protein [Gloeocapsopsis crepidinum]MBE9193536.1 hypothetical protein [Gloeocapsopsis crepidinum LEGE 06123]